MNSLIPVQLYMACAAVGAMLILSSVSAQDRASLPVVIQTTKDQAAMVLIPQGEFTYGINPAERQSLLKKLGTPELDVFETEFEEMRIDLPDYYIDKYEVTNSQYAVFLRETEHVRPRFWNSKLYGGPRQPVVGVSWEDAMAYAQWAGKRLPTEEEWEKAARGTKGFIWPWGNEPSGGKYNGKAQANFRPLDVGSFDAGASPYGVMDMAGNVYEMTAGKWVDGSFAMRGGSFLNAGATSRTMFRWALSDKKGAEFLGFRCVLDTEKITSKTIAFGEVESKPEEIWGVVYGADKDIDKAKYETTTIAKKYGITNAEIYYRDGWYRSVVTTTDRAEADNLLEKATKRNARAYVRAMSEWCPNRSNKDGHFVCSPR